MQCPHCGFEQGAERPVCAKCGTKLGEPQPEVSVKEAASGQPPPASPSKDEEDKILRELKEALSDESGQTWRSLFRLRWMWLGLALLLCLLAFGSVRHFLLKRRAVSVPPPPPPKVVEPMPISPPVVDEATRNTVGKMAAILEAIQKYEENKKTLPLSLLSINKGYAEPESLRDGWGQNLLYLVDVANKNFILQSLGPDGRRGTADDLTVSSEDRETWLKDHEQSANEWRLASPNLYSQMVSVGPTVEELKKLEMARKSEALEKKRREEALQAEQRKKEAELRRQEAAQQDEEKRKQAEARKREEDLRQAKLREEAQRQQALRQASVISDNFSGGLTQWDALSTWEVGKEKDFSVLRVQGLGFLKMNPAWDDYKIEFDIRVNKESAGWVLRAQNSSSFYLVKLGSEKAKAVPKNALIKYIFSEGKYLNSLKREDAPGAAGVVPLPFKVRNKDYSHVIISLKGPNITHSINGVQVDSWTDNTFERGRFGFNASIIELASIRNFSLEPLK
ncbi:MAG TPA: hypothetical protein VMW38_03545 [Terriglobia bacterium]|nr:hypothetical protein [Terriglobia bacterium]